jgi:hypothetical protein
LNKVITFTNIFGMHEMYPPEPASKNIPDWYKDLESYIGGKKTYVAVSPATIKKCMPVFDAISIGYIIKTASDVYVSQKDGYPFYSWSSMDVIEFHDVNQAPNHPNRKGLNVYPKFLNPWSIKTKKGYSTLFINPMHRDSPFTILPGVVDTDKYYAPVNFPFILNDPKFEGLIPAGTPLAQVIPFKRKRWSMVISKKENIKEVDSHIATIRSKFFDAYKNRYRQEKEYR